MCKGWANFLKVSNSLKPLVYPLEKYLISQFRDVSIKHYMKTLQMHIHTLKPVLHSIYTCARYCTV